MKQHLLAHTMAGLLDIGLGPLGRSNYQQWAADIFESDRDPCGRLQSPVVN